MSDKIIGKIKTAPSLQGNMQQDERILGYLAYSTYELNKDYNKLANKPSIEGVVLINDRSLDELGIQEKGDYANSRITNMELEEIFRN